MIQGKAKSPISSNLLPAACPHVGGLVPSHSFVERQNWSGFRLELFGLHLPPATWPPTSCWSAWRGLWQSWPSSGQLAAGISLLVSSLSSSILVILMAGMALPILPYFPPWLSLGSYWQLGYLVPVHPNLLEVGKWWCSGSIFSCYHRQPDSTADIKSHVSIPLLWYCSIMAPLEAKTCKPHTQECYNSLKRSITLQTDFDRKHF